MTTCPRCGASVAESADYCWMCGLPLRPDPGAAAAPPPPKPKRRLALKILLGIVVFLAAACVVFLVAASVWDPVALPLSVIAAVVPALFYSWLVLRLDKYEAEPRRAIIGAFAWGAVGAILFSVIAELIFGSLLVGEVGEEGASFLTVAVGAPIIEEFFKGIALLVLLWFFRREFDNVLDGLVYGALIGLGFAMTENILYFGQAYLDDGARGLGELFVVRAIINGFGHALYTGTTGAALGWSRTRYHRGLGRFLVPILGFGLAVLQHFCWNAGLFVIAGLLGNDVSIWSVVLIEAPLFTLPVLIVLYLIARTSSRRELQILRDQLAPEVQRGVLTPDEYRTLTAGPLRREATRTAKRRGGRPLLKQQQRFFQTAAELAFRKYHLSRGELPKPGQQAHEDAYRAELARLRGELSAAGIATASA
ncbi:MAG: protease PrsW [Thermomicrobiales bacterium]|nr:protease PrsW [Thermomicrobiales bacterium]